MVLSTGQRFQTVDLWEAIGGIKPLLQRNERAYQGEARRYREGKRP